jgi:hypothetical protein
VDVQLVNQTNTAVSYEVIGSTDQRMLNGRSTATLQGLAVPINITFVRPDGGFVQVTPRETAPGVLEVTLIEAADVDNGQGALNIQENGNVYLN